MMTTEQDLEERMDILEILNRSVIHQENEEISRRLGAFRSDNVQWLLNMLSYTFDQLQDALDLEYYSMQNQDF
jgi:hypothetical protein